MLAHTDEPDLARAEPSRLLLPPVEGGLFKIAR